MPRFLAGLPRRFFLGVMLLGFAVMTAESLAYFDFERVHPFVVEKLPLRFEAVWLASLRIHVASALLAFPLCLLLMTRTLQRRPPWHRWIGRFTGSVVLLALVPSGVVLAFDAKGGAAVTLGFLLSAAIVAGGTLMGVLAARRRNLALHRRAMLHVVGQMSVAVSSRAMMIVLDARGIDPDVAYVVALWVPVLGSAAVAELACLRSGFSISSSIQPVERFRREISALSPIVRLRSFVRPIARLGR